jgi:hypothetical protein
VASSLLYREQSGMPFCRDAHIRACNTVHVAAGLSDACICSLFFRIHDADKVEGNVANGSNMGSLEKLIERRIKELARPMLRYGAQLIADNQTN